MKCKLYPNIKRMTTGFCISILCVTLSLLGLRLTVFSDVAPSSERASSNLVSSEEDGYQISDQIFFSKAGAKGDLFISNLSEENLIKVNITLADTGDSILSTGFINPGASYPSSTMNPFGQQLADGQYNCIAEISAYHRDDVKTVVGTAQTEIQVYIGERPDSKAK